MKKKTILKLNTYNILSDTIESAIRSAWERRVWKHRDNPLLQEDIDAVVTPLLQEIMSRLSQVIRGLE